MFVEWDFLLAEIWVLLALAALIGLIAGWLIWGGRADVVDNSDEIRRLQAQLDREKQHARGPVDDVPAMQGGGYVRPSVAVPTPAPKLMAKPSPEPVKPPPPPEPQAPQTTKPVGLTGPRDGLPDDLTKINGVGVKLEKLCNSLGFWHYDQIAEWRADEIAWVDDNLEGFKGRVSRDQWVDQAKALAQNAPPAFVRRRD